MVEDLEMVNILHVVNISLRFSYYTEVDASEFLENLEEMFPGY